MENASKALIIAAAVLVAIILVATGVLLIKNIGDTAGQAHKVGNSISDATGNASFDAIGGTKGVIISKEKFNRFAENFKEKYKTSSEFQAAILQQNNKLRDQIEIIGYVAKIKHNDVNRRYNAQQLDKYSKDFEEKLNGWIKSLKENDELEEIPSQNVYDIDAHLKQLKDVYKEVTGRDDFDAKKTWARWFLCYDEWGYIYKAIFIASVDW